MAGSYSSPFRSLLAAAFMACASIGVAVARVTTRVATVTRRALVIAWDWVVVRLARLVDRLPRPARVWPLELAGELLAMRHYVARQSRLQRPQVLPQWRLAPSI